VEQEIYDLHRYWAHYCNHEFVKDPSKGKESYDIDEVLYFDLMGISARGHFGAAYDKIGPYFASANVAYKDLEVTAVNRDFGYSTMVQHYWGKTSDNHDFDFTYRVTALFRRIDGKFKWSHEHLSFPVDIATRKADFNSEIDALDSLYVGEKP
jgi:ketosteroid isomerase-like protein